MHNVLNGRVEEIPFETFYFKNAKQYSDHRASAFSNTQQSSMSFMPHKAIDFCDAMTPDHCFRLISYFVFSSGLLPQSVWRFLSTGLPAVVSSLSLMMLMRERCFV